jgi:Family of unknown function (DUF5681)
MPFAKGQSGNPAGRPVGSRNKFTSEMRDALDESGPVLIQRLLELAGEGNTGAMRQCLDRLMGKHRPSAVQLPAPDSPTYVIDALIEIHRALGAGEIATDEASRLVDLVGRTARVLAAKAIAVIDFADRLERCEQILRTLLDAGRPAATPDAGWTPAAQQATPEPDVDNNNAEAMAPVAAEADRPVAAPAAESSAIENNNGITMEAAAPDEPARATPPRRRDRVKQDLMSSVSPSALPLTEAA